MTNQIETFSPIKRKESALELCYRMFEHPVEGTARYGVSVENVRTGECAAVEDVTSVKGVAEDLLGRLSRGQVTPVSLRDVVEDFLAR